MKRNWITEVQKGYELTEMKWVMENEMGDGNERKTNGLTETKKGERCYTWRSLVLCSAQHQKQKMRKTQWKVRAQQLGKGELLRVR